MSGIEQMRQIEVVRATSDDAPKIQELLKQSFLNTYPNEHAVDPEFRVTRDDVIQHYKDELSSEGLAKLAEELAEPEAGVTDFIARERGEVIGYLRVTRSPNKNELTRIHVLPDRKGGVGSSLWKRALTVLDAQRDITLMVVEYNATSIAIYDHWGFVKTGKQKDIPMKSGAIRKEIEMVRKAENAA
jgi:ribosomal protein S18 acetylase RimI-like enzyme